MPNGHVHASVASKIVIATTGIALVGLYRSDPLVTLAGVGTTLGALGGLLVSPDIDLYQSTTYEEHRILRMFGPLGWLWIAYFWITYSRWHGHHGHGSHRPIVGTIPRFLLLWWPLGVATYFALVRFPGYGHAAIIVWIFIFFGHAVLQDCVHIAMDVAVGEVHHLARTTRHPYRRW